MPEYVKAGQTVWLGRPPQETQVEMPVGESCGSNEGHWYCSDCREHFPHNLAVLGHYADDESGTRHRMTWICHEHGPETP
jgi:hypothetical protein